MAFSEPLDVFLADFGVPVSFTGSAAGMLGLEDVPELVVLDDQGRGRIRTSDRTVLIRTDQKGSLKIGDAITVNSVARTVRDMGVPVDMADGAFTLVALQ